jgi:hypothetical protein
MEQSALFHDSIYDALGADVSASGGMKTVAHALWPTLDITTATTRLRSALNPEHAQKLCPEEVLAIKQMAHKIGSHASIDYEKQRLGFEVEWIRPEDARATLQREFIDAVHLVEQLGKRYQALQR